MAAILAIIFVGVLLVVLWAIMRFSIISPWKTKGAAGRLRSPEPAGVADLCGFPPPPELVELYLRAPFAERFEFELVDGGRQPPTSWPIGEFVPLTPLDVREARAVSGAKDGIPIAYDLDKGTYLVLRNGAVVLRSPNVDEGEVMVASSAAALAAFEVRAATAE